MEFNLQSDFKPAGDQPQAIETLVNGVEQKHKHQVLLGITGSGNYTHHMLQKRVCLKFYLQG